MSRARPPYCCLSHSKKETAYPKCENSLTHCSHPNQTILHSGCECNRGENDDIDEDFRPFISQGFVSLVDDATPVPVTILRDTAAKQSLILSNILPFSPQSYCGSDILAWGVKMSAVRAPLHFVQLSSKLASGKFKISVRPQLPIAGVDLILGNDLAGGKVFPSPEVIESPVADLSVSDPVASDSVLLFPVCVVTCAQARKFGDLVDLSDSFFECL